MSADPDEIAAIRLGHGLSPRHGLPSGVAGHLAAVADASRPDGWTTDTATAAQVRLTDGRRSRAAGTISQDDFAAIAADLDRQRLAALQHRVARGLDAQSGFGERLVQFWADHFTVVSKNAAQVVMAAAFVDEALRPHLAGRFADMLVAAETHPMMLIYLDQVSSYGPRSPFVRRKPDKRLGLNENLGREILELHTLGTGGGYAQDDVRQLALLLTGLGYNARADQRFRPERAEPGAETVLGRSYGGRGTDGLAEIGRALRDLAQHPATAYHLARKLAVHFVADDPPADLVADLAATWRGTGGDLGQVNAVLAGHPALAAGFRHKARQPIEFLIAALRSLGVRGADVLAYAPKQASQALWGPLQLMGQPFGRPRGPDGWPETASDWITPQMLAARITWALRQPARLVDPLPDPRAFLSAALGSTASPALAAAIPRAESAAEGVALVLASADFNRR